MPLWRLGERRSSWRRRGASLCWVGSERSGRRSRQGPPSRRIVRERVLSERELNRAILARQHLLERASGSLSRTIERVGGLQTQYAPAGYIALRARHEGFRRDDLTRALHRKAVVQAWIMR